MPELWYALQSHPHKEAALASHLQSNGYAVFYPRLKVNPVNPRARKVRPYFPGYLFIQVDLEKTGVSTFQWMPQARGLVSFGGDPAVVPESLIHAIRRRVEEINLAGGETLEGLHPGDAVTIEHGPFSGYEAIFDSRLPGSERVRVLLKMLSRQQVPLELNVGSIRKHKKQSR